MNIRYPIYEGVYRILTLKVPFPVLRPPCFGCRIAHRTGNFLRLSLQPSCFKLTGQFNNLAVQVGKFYRCLFQFIEKCESFLL